MQNLLLMTQLSAQPILLKNKTPTPQPPVLSFSTSNLYKIKMTQNIADFFTWLDWCIYAYPLECLISITLPFLLHVASKVIKRIPLFAFNQMCKSTLFNIATLMIYLVYNQGYPAVG